MRCRGCYVWTMMSCVGEAAVCRRRSSVWEKLRCVARGCSLRETPRFAGEAVMCGEVSLYGRDHGV